MTYGGFFVVEGLGFTTFTNVPDRDDRAATAASIRAAMAACVWVEARHANQNYIAAQTAYKNLNVSENFTAPGQARSEYVV